MRDLKPTFFFNNPGPAILEPEVKPNQSPTIAPAPNEDDPFYFPFPKQDPTPKA